MPWVLVARWATAGTLSAVVSATATILPGVNTLMISDNGGPGKPSPVTLNNGIHAITITATDQAGSSKSISQTVSRHQ
jgi:hypothetical protein